MMEVFIIAGFLGSGKTTLIRHLLTSKMEDIGKIALLVNEVGDIGVDGVLLKGQNVEMMEITSGCICCTMKTDFSGAVQEIHDRVNPDLLIVEATGVAQPGDILDVLYEPPINTYSEIRNLITVVDADFFKAKDVLGPFYNNQIQSADTLILNKIDLVSPETLQGIHTSLRDMNHRASVYTTQYCAVDLSQLLQRYHDDEDMRRQGYQGNTLHEHVRQVHDHPDEGGFESFSFEENRPMDREKLDSFLRALPPNLFRLKGWVKFPQSFGLVNFTAGRYSIAPWDETKNTALAFVGYNCSRKEILTALKDCLIPEPPSS